MRNLERSGKGCAGLHRKQYFRVEALKYVKYVKALDPAKITSDTVPYLGNPGRYVELDGDE